MNQRGPGGHATCRTPQRSPPSSPPAPWATGQQLVFFWGGGLRVLTEGPPPPPPCREGDRAAHALNLCAIHRVLHDMSLQVISVGPIRFGCLYLPILG